MKDETPFEKRSCYDCAHIKGYVSLWCGNKDAIKSRGTSIPGIIHCPFWKPDWKYIDKKYHPKKLKKVGLIRRIVNLFR